MSPFNWYCIRCFMHVVARMAIFGSWNQGNYRIYLSFTASHVQML